MAIVLEQPSVHKSYRETSRTRLRRHPERGNFDREAVRAILDEALICHLGFVQDGQPFVIPTLHARIGETLFVHGAAASRALNEVRKGIPVCLTVTITDGLVLAKSAFNHSMNFRSVIVLGTAKEVLSYARRVEA